MLSKFVKSYVSTCLAAVLLVACGGGEPDATLTDAEFLSAVETAAPITVPAGLAQAAAGTELVRNGDFRQGDMGWLQSTRRNEVGNGEKIIGALLPGVELPPNGQSTVARMCGFRTEASIGGTTTRINCFDILKTAVDIVVPKGSTSITLSANAFASYACAGDMSASNPAGHGALMMTLRATDGQSAAKPGALNAKESALPPGSWQKVSLQVSDLPGIAEQDRKFQLMLNFQTGTACRPPHDENTYVLITDISVRAN